VRASLLFPIFLAALALSACTSSSSGLGGPGGEDAGPADAGDPGSDGLFIEITGTGEARLTAGCTSPHWPGDLLPGPSAEVMRGELGAFVVSACRQSGGASGPSVSIIPDDIWLTTAGTYPAEVAFTDAHGQQRQAAGSVTLDFDAACPMPLPPDAGPPPIVTGSYTASHLTPVVPLDAGTVPDAGAIDTVSGAFRVYLLCEDGGA
jgi:hypothetical protein